MIDDEDFDRTSAQLELQPKLFLYSGKDRRTTSVCGRGEFTGSVLYSGAQQSGRSFAVPFQMDIKQACKSGLVDDGSAHLA